MGTARLLYDLAGRDPDFRFSPYCWRARLALAHKGLPVETRPWRFHETSRLEFSGQARVPVLVDGDQIVSDSWAIAVYLEKTYPDMPSLFGNPAAVPVVRALNFWSDLTLNPALSRLIVKRVHDCLDAQDQAYFRSSREKRFGATLEAIEAGHEQNLNAVKLALVPMQQLLETQAYLSGDAPAYADHILAGSLQWATLLAPSPLFAPNEPLARWFSNMLDAYGGLARRAHTLGSA